jgi:hypothetical protein
LLGRITLKVFRYQYAIVTPTSGLLTGKPARLAVIKLKRLFDTFVEDAPREQGPQG